MTQFSKAELKTLGYIYDELMIGRSIDIAMRRMRGLSEREALAGDKAYDTEIVGIPYRGWSDPEARWRRFIDCRDYGTPDWWRATCINHGGTITTLSVVTFRGDEAAMRADLCATRLALG